MTPLRLGIIGCGNVLDAYAPQCQKLRQRGLAEWVIACGRPAQEARARSLGVPEFTADEEDVIRRSDVVMILTSMSAHGRLARVALEAGRHVLLEKPLATTLEEGAALRELARTSKGFLVCAPFTLLSPTFQEVASRITRGEIGKPCVGRGRYGWSGPWWNEWFYGSAGGCIFDLGVYSLTSLTGLLGPARQVVAMTGIAIPERVVNGKRIRVEAEDTAHVLLDFGGGASAVVTTGFTMQQYRSPALEVYGTEGTIQMLGDDWDPDGFELWRNAAGCWQVFKETAPDWPWTDGLRHLVECIHSGTQPVITPAHAFHVLEIMLRARESGRSGKALRLESTFTPPSFAASGPGEEAHRQHDRTREHFPEAGVA